MKNSHSQLGYIKIVSCTYILTSFWPLAKTRCGCRITRIRVFYLYPFGADERSCCISEEYTMGKMNVNLLDLLLIMILQRTFTPLTSYTSFNLVAIAYSILRKRQELLPILCTNTLALQLTFYGMRLFVEPKFFELLRERFKCRPYQFIIGDVLAHFVPSAMFIYSLVAYKSQWRSMAVQFQQSVLFSGFYSLFLNLSWAVLNHVAQFDVSHVYAPVSIYKWYLAWNVCVSSHVGVGAVLQKLLLPKTV